MYDVDICVKRTDLENFRNPSRTQNFILIAQVILHMHGTVCRYCIASEVMHIHLLLFLPSPGMK